MLLRLRAGATCLIAATLGLLTSNHALAGIMLDMVPELDYVAYSNQTQFSPIGRFTSGTSGTLIAPNWVLTAGHVGAVSGFQVRGSSIVYGVAEVIQHPTFIANGGDINFGYDLELVRLTSNATGVTPANIYRGSLEFDREVSITGYGLGGVGSAGDTLPAAQRAGTNVVDAIIDFSDAAGKTGAKNAMLIMDFDSGDAGFNTLSSLGSSSTPTLLEYHLAGGDSGGGVFIFENEQWYLAGVNSGVESQKGFTKAPASSDNLFGYGAISYVTRVSSFTGFIDSNITAVPEPGSLALVSFITICLLGRKLFQRHMVDAG